MTVRFTEDLLREEYNRLVPSLRRVRERLETEIRHALLPLTGGAQNHERIEVFSRIKECESAIEKLRKKASDGSRSFRPDQVYSLTSLKDLVGVKILVFPREIRYRVHEALRERYPDWIYDPYRQGEALGFKYFGQPDGDEGIIAEYQIQPTLVGRYMEVEHGAIYKSEPRLAAVRQDPYCGLLTEK